MGSYPSTFVSYDKLSPQKREKARAIAEELIDEHKVAVFIKERDTNMNYDFQIREILSEYKIPETDLSITDLNHERYRHGSDIQAYLAKRAGHRRPPFIFFNGRCEDVEVIVRAHKEGNLLNALNVMYGGGNRIVRTPQWTPAAH